MMALIQKDQLIQELKAAIRQAHYVADRLDISRQNDFNICNEADQKVKDLELNLETVTADRDQNYNKVQKLAGIISDLNVEIERLKNHPRKVLSARILELEERIARMMLGETFRDDQQIFNKVMDRVSEDLRKTAEKVSIKTETANLGESKISSVHGETYTFTPASSNATPAPDKPTEETLEMLFRDTLGGITIRMDGMWDTELCCKQCKAEGVSQQRLSFSATSGLICQYHGQLR
jgi:hypothetical protein